MIDKLLKTKPRLLIGLSFGPVILWYVIYTVQVMTMTFDAMQSTTINNDEIQRVASYHQSILYILLYPAIIMSLGWWWAIYSRLFSILPEQVKMRAFKFKAAFFTATTYILGIIALALIAGSQLNNLLLKYFFIILPYFFAAIFSYAYCAYFLVKVYTSIKLQREAKFIDFTDDFAMFLVPPIGMFVKHSKIKDLIEKE